MDRGIQIRKRRPAVPATRDAVHTGRVRGAPLGTSCYGAYDVKKEQLLGAPPAAPGALLLEADLSNPDIPAFLERPAVARLIRENDVPHVTEKIDPAPAIRFAARQLRATAHHEAGHAVASWAMQREHGWHWCQFHRVFIVRPEEFASQYVNSRDPMGCFLGMIDGPHRFYPPGLYVPTMPFFDIDPDTGASVPANSSQRAEIVGLWRRNMEADVVEILAGLLAEARYSRRSLLDVVRNGGATDHDAARRWARAFALTATEMPNLMCPLWERADVLMRRRDVRAAVNALAEELLRLWTIEGDQAVKIINSAAGWNSPSDGRGVGSMPIDAKGVKP